MSVVYDELLDIKRCNTNPTMDIFRVRGKLLGTGKRVQEHVSMSELRKLGYGLMEHVHAIRVVRKPHVLGYYTVRIVLRNNINHCHSITFDNFPNSLSFILKYLELFILLFNERSRLESIIPSVKKLNDPLSFLYLAGFIEYFKLLERFATNGASVMGISKINMDRLCSPLLKLGLLTEHEVFGMRKYKRANTKEQFNAIREQYQNQFIL